LEKVGSGLVLGTHLQSVSLYATLTIVDRHLEGCLPSVRLPALVNVVDANRRRRIGRDGYGGDCRARWRSEGRPWPAVREAALTQR
jgi:hypothetical protein